MRKFQKIRDYRDKYCKYQSFKTFVESTFKVNLHIVIHLQTHRMNSFVNFYGIHKNYWIILMNSCRVALIKSTNKGFFFELIILDKFYFFFWFKSESHTWNWQCPIVWLWVTCIIIERKRYMFVFSRKNTLIYCHIHPAAWASKGDLFWTWNTGQAIVFETPAFRTFANFIFL